MKFQVYIPARYGATRLPGKPLLPLRGKPLVEHVYRRAVDSGAARVVIATDDERIHRVVSAFGGEVVMTDANHPSGTDRVHQAAELSGAEPDDVIVNVQGDEPDMPADVIRQVAHLCHATEVDIATVCEPLESSQVNDPNVVKVVRSDDDFALYFSRAPIPWDRENFSVEGAVPDNTEPYRRHVGIYGFRFGFLQRYVGYPRGPLEELEKLEQLRALSMGARIAVPDALAACGAGVDTPDDLRRLEATDGGNVA